MGGPLLLFRGHICEKTIPAENDITSLLRRFLIKLNSGNGFKFKIQPQFLEYAKRNLFTWVHVIFKMKFGQIWSRYKKDSEHLNMYGI